MLGSIVHRCDRFAFLQLRFSTQNLRHWVSACWEARSWSLGLAILHVVVVGWPRCFEPQFLCSRRRTPSRHVSTSNYSFQRIPLPKKTQHQATPSAWADYKGYIMYIFTSGYLGIGMIHKADALRFGSKTWTQAPAGADDAQRAPGTMAPPVFVTNALPAHGAVRTWSEKVDACRF